MGEISVNDIKATIKGSEESLNLAFGNDGAYEHSISIDNAVDREVFLKMVEEVMNNQ